MIERIVAWTVSLLAGLVMLVCHGPVWLAILMAGPIAFLLVGRKRDSVIARRSGVLMAAMLVAGFTLDCFGFGLGLIPLASLLAVLLVGIWKARKDSMRFTAGVGLLGLVVGSGWWAMENALPALWAEFQTVFEASPALTVLGLLLALVVVVPVLFHFGFLAVMLGWRLFTAAGDESDE